MNMWVLHAICFCFLGSGTLGLCHDLKKKAMFFESNVYGVAFSNDGKLLASAHRDKKVRLWDVESGLVKRVFEGHRDWVTSVAFLPNGRKLVSGSLDGTVRVWNVDTGKEEMVLAGGNSLSLGFSPDSARLASSGSFDSTAVALWDTKTWQSSKILKGHTTTIASLSFSPNNKMLATAGIDGVIMIWNLADGSQKRKITILNNKRLFCVAFAPDSSTLATGDFDGFVRIWDVSKGTENATLKGHKGYVRSLCFTPDGKFLASAGEDLSIRIWETKTGTTKSRLDGNRFPVNSIVFSQNGEMLASASGYYDKGGEVIIWDLRNKLAK